MLEGLFEQIFFLGQSTKDNLDPFLEVVIPLCQLFSAIAATFALTLRVIKRQFDALDVDDYYKKVTYQQYLTRIVMNLLAIYYYKPLFHFIIYIPSMAVLSVMIDALTAINPEYYELLNEVSDQQHLETEQSMQDVFGSVGFYKVLAFVIWFFCRMAALLVLLTSMIQQIIYYIIGPFVIALYFIRGNIGSVMLWFQMTFVMYLWPSAVVCIFIVITALQQKVDIVSGGGVGYNPTIPIGLWSLMIQVLCVLSFFRSKHLLECVVSLSELTDPNSDEIPGDYGWFRVKENFIGRNLGISSKRYFGGRLLRAAKAINPLSKSDQHRALMAKIQHFAQGVRGKGVDGYNTSNYRKGVDKTSPNYIRLNPFNYLPRTSVTFFPGLTVKFGKPKEMNKQEQLKAKYLYLNRVGDGGYNRFFRDMLRPSTKNRRDLEKQVAKNRNLDEQDAVKELDLRKKREDLKGKLDTARKDVKTTKEELKKLDQQIKEFHVQSRVLSASNQVFAEPCETKRTLDESIRKKYAETQVKLKNQVADLKSIQSKFNFYQGQSSDIRSSRRLRNEDYVIQASNYSIAKMNSDLRLLKKRAVQNEKTKAKIKALESKIKQEEESLAKQTKQTEAFRGQVIVDYERRIERRKAKIDRAAQLGYKTQQQIDDTKELHLALVANQEALRIQRQALLDNNFIEKRRRYSDATVNAKLFASRSNPEYMKDYIQSKEDYELALSEKEGTLYVGGAGVVRLDKEIRDLDRRLRGHSGGLSDLFCTKFKNSEFRKQRAQGIAKDVDQALSELVSFANENANNLSISQLESLVEKIKKNTSKERQKDINLTITKLQQLINVKRTDQQRKSKGDSSKSLDVRDQGTVDKVTTEFYDLLNQYLDATSIASTTIPLGKENSSVIDISQTQKVSAQEFQNLKEKLQLFLAENASKISIVDVNQTITLFEQINKVKLAQEQRQSITKVFKAFSVPRVSQTTSLSPELSQEHFDTQFKKILELDRRKDKFDATTKPRDTSRLNWSQENKSLNQEQTDLLREFTKLVSQNVTSRQQAVDLVDRLSTKFNVQPYQRANILRKVDAKLGQRKTKQTSLDGKADFEVKLEGVLDGFDRLRKDRVALKDAQYKDRQRLKELKFEKELLDAGSAQERIELRKEFKDNMLKVDRLREHLKQTSLSEKKDIVTEKKISQRIDSELTKENPIVLDNEWIDPQRANQTEAFYHFRLFTEHRLNSREILPLFEALEAEGFLKVIRARVPIDHIEKARKDLSRLAKEIDDRFAEIREYDSIRKWMQKYSDGSYTSIGRDYTTIMQFIEYARYNIEYKEGRDIKRLQDIVSGRIKGKDLETMDKTRTWVKGARMSTAVFSYLMNSDNPEIAFKYDRRLKAFHEKYMRKNISNLKGEIHTQISTDEKVKGEKDRRLEIHDLVTTMDRYRNIGKERSKVHRSDYNKGNSWFNTHFKNDVPGVAYVNLWNNSRCASWNMFHRHIPMLKEEREEKDKEDRSSSKESLEMHNRSAYGRFQRRTRHFVANWIYRPSEGIRKPRRFTSLDAAGQNAKRRSSISKAEAYRELSEREKQYKIEKAAFETLQVADQEQVKRIRANFNSDKSVGVSIEDINAFLRKDIPKQLSQIRTSKQSQQSKEVDASVKPSDGKSSVNLGFLGLDGATISATDWEMEQLNEYYANVNHSLFQGVHLSESSQKKLGLYNGKSMLRPVVIGNAGFDTIKEFPLEARARVMDKVKSQKDEKSIDSSSKSVETRTSLRSPQSSSSVKDVLGDYMDKTSSNPSKVVYDSYRLQTIPSNVLNKQELRKLVESTKATSSSDKEVKKSSKESSKAEFSKQSKVSSKESTKSFDVKLKAKLKSSSHTSSSTASTDSNEGVSDNTSQKVSFFTKLSSSIYSKVNTGISDAKESLRHPLRELDSSTRKIKQVLGFKKSAEVSEDSKSSKAPEASLMDFKYILGYELSDRYTQSFGSGQFIRSYTDKVEHRAKQLENYVLFTGERLDKIKEELAPEARVLTRAIRRRAAQKRLEKDSKDKDKQTDLHRIDAHLESQISKLVDNKEAFENFRKYKEDQDRLEKEEKDALKGSKSGYRLKPIDSLAKKVVEGEVRKLERESKRLQNKDAYDPEMKPRYKKDMDVRIAHVKRISKDKGGDGNPKSDIQKELDRDKVRQVILKEIDDRIADVKSFSPITVRNPIKAEKTRLQSLKEIGDSVVVSNPFKDKEVRLEALRELRSSIVDNYGDELSKGAYREARSFRLLRPILEATPDTPPSLITQSREAVFRQAIQVPVLRPLAYIASADGGSTQYDLKSRTEVAKEVNRMISSKIFTSSELEVIKQTLARDRSLDKNLTRFTDDMSIERNARSKGSATTEMRKNPYLDLDYKGIYTKGDGRSIDAVSITRKEHLGIEKRLRLSRPSRSSVDFGVLSESESISVLQELVRFQQTKQKHLTSRSLRSLTPSEVKKVQKQWDEDKRSLDFAMAKKFGTASDVYWMKQDPRYDHVLESGRPSLSTKVAISKGVYLSLQDFKDSRALSKDTQKRLSSFRKEQLEDLGYKEGATQVSRQTYVALTSNPRYTGLFRVKTQPNDDKILSATADLTSSQEKELKKAFKDYLQGPVSRKAKALRIQEVIQSLDKDGEETKIQDTTQDATLKSAFTRLLRDLPDYGGITSIRQTSLGFVSSVDLSSKEGFEVKGISEGTARFNRSYRVVKPKGSVSDSMYRSVLEDMGFEGSSEDLDKEVRDLQRLTKKLLKDRFSSSDRGLSSQSGVDAESQELQALSLVLSDRLQRQYKDRIHARFSKSGPDSQDDKENEKDSLSAKTKLSSSLRSHLRGLYPKFSGSSKASEDQSDKETSKKVSKEVSKESIHTDIRSRTDTKDRKDEAKKDKKDNQETKEKDVNLSLEASKVRVDTRESTDKDKQKDKKQNKKEDKQKDSKEDKKVSSTSLDDIPIEASVSIDVYDQSSKSRTSYYQDSKASHSRIGNHKVISLFKTDQGDYTYMVRDKDEKADQKSSAKADVNSNQKSSSKELSKASSDGTKDWVDARRVAQLRSRQDTDSLSRAKIGAGKELEKSSDDFTKASLYAKGQSTYHQDMLVGSKLLDGSKVEDNKSHIDQKLSSSTKKDSADSKSKSSDTVSSFVIPRDYKEESSKYIKDSIAKIKKIVEQDDFGKDKDKLGETSHLMRRLAGSILVNDTFREEILKLDAMVSKDRSDLLVREREEKELKEQIVQSYKEGSPTYAEYEFNKLFIAHKEAKTSKDEKKQKDIEKQVSELSSKGFPIKEYTYRKLLGQYEEVKDDKDKKEEADKFKKEASEALKAVLEERKSLRELLSKSDDVVEDSTIFSVTPQQRFAHNVKHTLDYNAYRASLSGEVSDAVKSDSDDKKSIASKVSVSDKKQDAQKSDKSNKGEKTQKSLSEVIQQREKAQRDELVSALEDAYAIRKYAHSTTADPTAYKSISDLAKEQYVVDDEDLDTDDSDSTNKLSDNDKINLVELRSKRLSHLSNLGTASVDWSSLSEDEKRIIKFDGLMKDHVHASFRDRTKRMRYLDSSRLDDGKSDVDSKGASTVMDSEARRKKIVDGVKQRKDQREKDQEKLVSREKLRNNRLDYFESSAFELERKQQYEHKSQYDTSLEDSKKSYKYNPIIEEQDRYLGVTHALSAPKDQVKVDASGLLVRTSKNDDKDKDNSKDSKDKDDKFKLDVDALRAKRLARFASREEDSTQTYQADSTITIDKKTREEKQKEDHIRGVLRGYGHGDGSNIYSVVSTVSSDSDSSKKEDSSDSESKDSKSYFDDLGKGYKLSTGLKEEDKKDNTKDSKKEDKKEDSKKEDKKDNTKDSKKEDKKEDSKKEDKKDNTKDSKKEEDKKDIKKDSKESSYFDKLSKGRQLFESDIEEDKVVKDDSKKEEDKKDDKKEEDKKQEDQKGVRLGANSYISSLFTKEESHPLVSPTYLDPEGNDDFKRVGGNDRASHDFSNLGEGRRLSGHDRHKDQSLASSRSPREIALQRRLAYYDSQDRRDLSLDKSKEAQKSSSFTTSGLRNLEVRRQWSEKQIASAQELSDYKRQLADLDYRSVVTGGVSSQEDVDLRKELLRGIHSNPLRYKDLSVSIDAKGEVDISRTEDRRFTTKIEDSVFEKSGKGKALGGKDLSLLDADQKRSVYAYQAEQLMGLSASSSSVSPVNQEVFSRSSLEEPLVPKYHRLDSQQSLYTVLESGSEFSIEEMPFSNSVRVTLSSNTDESNQDKINRERYAQEHYSLPRTKPSVINRLLRMQSELEDDILKSHIAHLNKEQQQLYRSENTYQNRYSSDYVISQYKNNNQAVFTFDPFDTENAPHDHLDHHGTDHQGIGYHYQGHVNSQKLRQKVDLKLHKVKQIMHLYQSVMQTADGFDDISPVVSMDLPPTASDILRQAVGRDSIRNVSLREFTLIISRWIDTLEQEGNV